MELNSFARRLIASLLIFLILNNNDYVVGYVILTDIHESASNINATNSSMACSSTNNSPENDQNCGHIYPSTEIRHYIHGGKKTVIEQWPWQVKTNLKSKL
jgi:hypothetical protein